MDLKIRKELFRVPSAAYRGKNFWSWNGRLEKEELESQLTVIKQMGFGGFYMHSRTGLETEYLGEEWFDLINAIADKGSEMGLEAWLYDEDRWPSGTAGGMVTEKQEFRSMYMYMEQYAPEQAEEIVWDENVPAGFACKLTDHYFKEEREFTAGMQAKEGETIVVFRIRYSDENENYNNNTYLNTMNQDAVQAFLQSTHEKYKEKCGKRLGKQIRGIFTDEPHRGALFSDFSEGSVNAAPYTQNLFPTFEARFGYDLRLRLLELFLRREGEDISKPARDYIELCQELFLEAYVLPYAKWCRENNMTFTGHFLQEDSLTAQTVMQGSLMRAYEYEDWPGVDHLIEENKCYWIVKQMISVSRQFKKKWSLSEMYGCTGWQMGFENYKFVGDWQALFGINTRCTHLSWYTMEGEAKRDYPASIFKQSAWHTEYHWLEEYFARLGVFMEGGKPDCGLLVLSPIESIWARMYSGAVQSLDAKDAGMKHIEEAYRYVFECLTGARIDFDYGEEDILSRHAYAENGLLHVGQCVYRKILVAETDTIRSSTYQLLKEMREQGGTVLFAGSVPEYIDCKVSEKGKELAEACTKLPLEEAELVSACAMGTEIRISSEKAALENLFSGKEEQDISLPEQDSSKNIFAQTKIDSERRRIMLLNMDRKRKWSNVRVCLGRGEYAECWNARTGETSAIQTVKSEGRLFIMADFEPGEEKLYVVYNKKAKKSVKLPDCVPYRLSEPNVCVLDYVEITTDQEEKVPHMEVLKADRCLRDFLRIPYRGGEAVQPWYAKKTEQSECLRTLTLIYTVTVSWIPPALELAVEDLENIEKITVNESELSLEKTGHWIDTCFSKLNIPPQSMKEGENSIQIQYRYYAEKGIEAVYLLGEFGVGLRAGQKPLIEPLPKQLYWGDITAQGLAFYSGAIAYEVTEQKDSSDSEQTGQKSDCGMNRKKTGESALDETEAESAMETETEVEVEEYFGSCLKFCGKQDVLVPFAPYKAKVCGLKEIQVVLTRRNTFGPLHQIPKKDMAYGPGNFLTGGIGWSDSYQLYKQGIQKKPKIRR